MNKLTVFLAALGLSVGVMAKNVDQDGREWISASDVDKSPLSGTELKRILKAYVILDNDIQKCYFPEIWKAKNNDALDKLRQQDEGRFSLYTRIYYRLPYAKLPEQILQGMDSTDLNGVYANSQLSAMKEKYKQTTSIKSKKDCQKIGKFIFEELLPNH